MSREIEKSIMFVIRDLTGEIEALDMIHELRVGESGEQLFERATDRLVNDVSSHLGRTVSQQEVLDAFWSIEEELP